MIEHEEVMKLKMEIQRLLNEYCEGTLESLTFCHRIIRVTLEMKEKIRRGQIK
jgi:hypothetical protein